MASSSAFKDLTGYFVYLLLTATIGPLLFGYHLAELNAPQDVITCEKKAIGASLIARIASSFHAEAAVDGLPQCIRMNATQFGLVSSFFTLGGLIGALASGPVSAKFGRLRTMQYNTIFFIAGGILEALAPNIGAMVVGRTISGLGAGASVVVVPIFISETAPPAQKGFFGAFTQVMINVGILIAQVLGFFLSKGSLWRIILAAAAAIGLIQTIGLVLGGSESPKWMAEHGKPSIAKRTLRKLRGESIDIEEEVKGWGTNEDEGDAEDEEQALLSGHDRPSTSQEEPPHTARETAHEAASMAKSASKSAPKEALGVISVLRDPQARPAIIAVSSVMVAQQLCGINRSYALHQSQNSR